MHWKDKFIMWTFIALIGVLAIIVFSALDNSDQPTATDVITNQGPSIYDFME